MVKVLGIAGSLRQGSHSVRLLREAMKEVESAGLGGQTLDLRELKLPFCDGGSSYPDFPDVARIQAAVEEADALILITPEYHGGVSGVMKNFLDLLSGREIEGKMVALMAVLGGAQSMNALNDLRTVCRQLHAWVLPDQLILPWADQAFDEKGELKDEKQQERLKRIVKDLLIACHRLTM